MSQIVPVGIDAEVQSGLYGGASPTTYEEGGTNGFGTRMTSVRRYRNWFTQPFSTSSIEGGFFDTGHLIVISVSNPTVSPGPSDFTHHKLAAGTYATDVDAMWDRIALLPYDANVTSQTRSITTTNGSATIAGTFTQADVGATFTSTTGVANGTSIISQTFTAAVMSANASASGSPTATIIQGLKQPNVVFIYNHEQDAKGPNGSPGKLYFSSGGTTGTKDTATDFINAWIYLWNRWQARAAAHSVPTSRVQFCWNMTSFGTVPDRVSQYWPGGQFVDIIGMDIYLTSTGVTVATDKYGSGARTYAIAKNKRLGVPEFNCAAADSSARASAFTSSSTFIANDTQCTWAFINFWVAPDGSSNELMNFNKIAGASSSGKSFPLTHAGIDTFVANLGNNPIRTGVTQGLPSVATGVAVTPLANGTTATGSWANPPGGDNVTGWWWYLAPGTTNVLVKQNSTPLSAATRSVSISGLTPSSPYSFDVVPINSAGQSGFGTIANFTTATPGGVNHAPNIANFTAVPEVAAPQSVDFNITATDPDSDPITITVTVTAPALGFSETFTMTSGVQTTRTYTTDGAYTASAAVSDGSLTTTAAAGFAVTSSGSVTPNRNWDISGLLPNTDPRGVGKTILPIVLELDTDVTNSQVAKAPHNMVHGLVGSAYDPINIAGTNVYTSASGHLLWVGMAVQDLQISGVTLVTATPQAGTGVQLGIHDANGSLFLDNAGNITSYGTTSAQTLAVDGWLQTSFTAPTPPPMLILPSPINVTPQTVVYVSLFFPAGLGTYPTFRETSTGSLEAAVNLSSQPRYGVATGQTAIVDPIPFGSWSNSFSSPVWIGLF